MVGISLASIRQAGRWAAAQSAPAKVGAVVATAVLLAGIGMSVQAGAAEARLVKVDADTAAADTRLLTGAAQRGRAIFKKSCASCHGSDGRGDRRVASPDLTDNDWLYGNGAASDIETVVLHGIRAPNGKTWDQASMPAYARAVPYEREATIKPLSPPMIRDLVQFLRSRRGDAADPAAAARGAEIYTNEGGCYDCHGSDARGDSSIGGPNLVDRTWLYGGSDGEIYDTIAGGRAGYCPDFDRRLSAGQIRAVALYVYSLSHTEATKGSMSAP